MRLPPVPGLPPALALAIALLLSLMVVLAIPGCGGEEGASDGSDGTPGRWQICRLGGLTAAGGLTIHGEVLIAVAGGNDRNLYAIARSDLEAGGPTRVRKLKVDVAETAPLLGSEKFALQEFQLRHLWALPLDFQCVAAQAPDWLAVGDRVRRVIFWGRLYKDASGGLARVKFLGLSALPGADRSGIDAGDWRDHGPGLSGMVAVSGRRRTEDLCIVDRGVKKGDRARIRKSDRFGSVIGGIPLRYDEDAPPEMNAISWDGSRYLVHHGKGRGRLVSIKEPDAMRSAAFGTGTPGPDVDGVERWTGMAHAADGTLYLISGGKTAVLAWRTP